MVSIFQKIKNSWSGVKDYLKGRRRVKIRGMKGNSISRVRSTATNNNRGEDGPEKNWDDVYAIYKQRRTGDISKTHLTRNTSPGEYKRNASRHLRHRRQPFRFAAAPLIPEIPQGEYERQKHDLPLDDNEKSVYVPSQSKEPWSFEPDQDVQTQKRFGDTSKGDIQKRGAKLKERRNNNLEEEKGQGRNEQVNTQSQRRRGLTKSPATILVETSPSMPAPLTAQNLKACQRGFVEAGAPSTLNRMLGDQTRTYIEGMTPCKEVDNIETKREIKPRRKRARH